MDLRENTNYRVSRFPDPEPPEHFRWVAEHGVRTALNMYHDDTTHLYTFDTDHAIVAFPLAALRRGLLEARKRASDWIDDPEQRLLRELLRDSSGPLTSALDIILPDS